MNPERRTRIKNLFFAATEQPDAMRAGFLANECNGDPEMLAEVESLLAAHDSADGFLDPVSPDLRTAALDSSDNSIGERVGPYRLAEKIGSGGMGDVYKAVRDDDQYRAQVAIKLMRGDVRSALGEQRFKNERQILASLDHRNIARLLDGGTTQTGLPYVVMELVAGEPIDRYCETNSLGIRERVQLFLQVCAAVSYAHQHLVVHRDLKPNNIFVTADGSVKLLDFGIAKLLEADAVTSAVTEETRTQFRLMTLEYASPEQVSGGAVTTVSDVYSLGVVLYRLITGQSPYRARDNDAARVAEILSDTSPTRPSQVESHTRATIDADLDHILLMALRKEPAKRYAGVDQLAADLRRYLDGEPVTARKGTLGYRFGKFARRHRVPIAAGLLVAISLFVGLGLALREARIANEQRAVAQRHFDSVRQLANTMINDVYGEIGSLPGAAKAREKLAQTSQRYLDELSKEANDPGLQADLANAYRKLGDIQGGFNSLGGNDSKRALESYAKSVALLENLLATDPTNEHARAGLVKSLLLQSRVVLSNKGPTTVLAAAQRTVELAESVQTGYVDDYDRLQTIGGSYYFLANVFTALERPEEAVPLYDKLIAVTEQYVAAHPDDVFGLKLLRNAYGNTALAGDSRLSKEAAFERSSALLRKSLAINDKLLAKEPDSVEHIARRADTQLIIADSLFTVGDYSATVEMYRLAMPVLAKAAEEKTDSRAQLQLAMCEAGLAAALTKSRRTNDAAPLFESAERRLKELLATDPENLYSRSTLAQVNVFRGEMYLIASAQSSNRGARIDALHRANDSLHSALQIFKMLNDRQQLVGGEKELMEMAVANLAKVDSQLAQKY